jgi:hypothetical protein
MIWAAWLLSLLLVVGEDLTIGDDIKVKVGDVLQEDEKVGPKLRGELDNLSQYLKKLYYGRSDKDREWKRVWGV